MGIELSVFLLILLAIFWEFVDSTFGMLYGTVLTPILLILGFPVSEVIPSILISQAVGGTVASWRHHDKGNAIFKKNSKDFKIAFFIFANGIIAVIIGAYIGNIMHPIYLTTYIGCIVIVMGTIVLANESFNFSWKKVAIIGFISSFNKAISGGAFGPIVASGLVISGKSGKSSIAITDFAEAPICLVGFFVWVILNNELPNHNLYLPLCLGAFIGGYFGPATLSKIKSNEFVIKILGIITIILGFWTLLKTPIAELLK